MNTVKVMVTGAGSGVGQGIIKSLHVSGLKLHIIAADINLGGQGLYRCDSAVLIPKLEEPGAMDRFLPILKRHQPDVVLVGSEFETSFFARNRRELELLASTHICSAPEEAVTLANDKWLTVAFLKKHGLPHAHAVLGENGHPPVQKVKDEIGYPCILKTRTGTSNRHVHIIRSEDQLLQVWPTVPNPMVQQLIAEPSSMLGDEYTCSVFRCSDGTLIGPFTARRTLRGGNSWLVEVDAFTSIFPTLLEVGKCLNFPGSLNIQLMQTAKGAVPFELNMRFSGTTAVRAHFGFNEPEMYIRNYILGQPLKQPEIRRGMALRYLEEVFVDNVLMEDIGADSIPKGYVRPWF